MSIKYIVTPRAKELLDKGINCLPTRGTPLSAGMDLKACTEEPIEIGPYETVKVLTGLKIYLGEVDYAEEVELAGLYLPRSSVKGLQLENTVGLLDCDYQGESFIKLYNKTEEVVTIMPGERLAQLVIVPVCMFDWEEVESFEKETIRGEGGDGSTGV